MFGLTDEQIQELKRWNDAQTDDAYLEWYDEQKSNSEEIRQILADAKFKEGGDLSLDELYNLSSLLRDRLGNTALAITGEKSIFGMNPIKTFNARLRDLLFGKAPIVDRVDKFIGLKGVGIMTVSQFLCLFDYRKYAFFASFMKDVFDEVLSIDEVQFEEAENGAKKEFGIVAAKYNTRTEDYFTYFVILREIKNALSLESYLQVQNLLWRIYYYAPSEEIEEEEAIPKKEEIPEILEAPLREFIARNLETIEKGLKLIQTKYRTKQGVGEIDILCQDAKGRFVVIEVKRWKDSDKVVGQILRYMGAIKEEKGSQPRGIIILNQEDKRLNYAASIVESIETKYYRFSFAISDKPAS